jgi:hypothetical protein
MGARPKASDSSGEVPELFRVGLRLLAAELAPLLVAMMGAPTSPRYADAKDNPYGSERAFKEAARNGEFPTFLRVRRTTALWTDVERAIEGHQRAKRAPVVVATQEDDDRAELAGLGVRLKPKKQARAAR